jgi:hypothetical protein
MIRFDANLLLSAMNARSTFQPTAPAASAESQEARRLAARKAAADRGAPWTSANAAGATEAANAARVRALLAGAALAPDGLRPARLATMSDAEQLFAAHRTIESLRLIAERAAAKSVPASEMAALQARFSRGMTEAQDMLAALSLDGVAAPLGAGADRLEQAFAQRRERSEMVTRPVHFGKLTDRASSFTPDMQFDIIARREGGDVRVTIDLAQMSQAEPTLRDVVGFVNGRLAQAGLVTRFAEVGLGKDPAAGPDAPERWGIRINGVRAEPLRFEASGGAPALYALTAEPGDRAGALVKLPANASDAPIFTERLAADATRVGPGALAVRASARGPDGAIYVVGDASGPVGSGMGLKGERDLVLSKYDSAGRRMWTRPLGASDRAEGLAIAVGADGKVAVAGALRGRLGAADGAGSGRDGVVALFEPGGKEIWTRRIASAGEDEARAVAIRADGTVIVGGRTNGDVGGGASAGGFDGFIRSFSATGEAGFMRRIGGVGEDGVTALALAGDGAILAAGMESGLAVLRKIDAAGADVWTRSTGALGPAGAVGVIAVDGASIALVGVATAQDIGVGQAPLAAASGLRDGYVAKFTDGASPALDWTSFLSGAGDESAVSASFVGGALVVAGTAREVPPGRTTAIDRAVVQAFDAASGASQWRRALGAAASAGAGVAIMADAAGRSALDAFGLPNGDLVFEDGAPLVERTALAAGDHFFVRVGENGARRRVEIGPADTLVTLTKRLNAIMGLSGAAQVSTQGPLERLTLRAQNNAAIVLERGGEGRDALGVLGLAPGQVRNIPSDPRAAARADAPRVVPLGFAADLKFSDAASAALADSQLLNVQGALQRAYNALFEPPRSAAPNRQPQQNAGPAPAVIQRQIANYQAGLARLMRGS